MGNALLITGAPGSGKTTVIRGVIAGLPVRAGGFVTEEIREGGERVGFRVSALDGRAGILAHVKAVRGPRVGRYQVDVAAFEDVGVAALESAIGQADLIVVDEIGKMELCSPRFIQALEAALASKKPLLGTILQAPHPWLDQLKRRPTVELYRLTERNREDLTDALLARLRTEVRQ
ncbi:MAG: NTPase [candidate division NC10 bacterium]|nr:NTPase [candidate division NC10 bacterium]